MTETMVLEETQSCAVPATRASVQEGKVPIYQVPAKYSHRFVPKSEAAVNAQVEKLNAAIAEAQTEFERAKSVLLPFEVLAKQHLERTHEGRMTRARRLLSSLRQQCKSYPFDENYARIDLFFLQTQNWSEKYQCPVPLFAIFLPDNPVCTLEVSAHTRQVFEGDFSTHSSLRQTKSGDKEYSFFESFYLPEYFDTTGLEELCKKEALAAAALRPAPEVGTMAQSSQRLSVTFDAGSCRADLKASVRFAGVIPDQARNLILESQRQFDAVYIVAEVPEWTISIDVEINQAPAPTPLSLPQGEDPLVIGRKDETFWLLSLFDTTHSEEYAALNFTNTSKSNQAL